MSSFKEEMLHRQVCSLLRQAYPRVMFTSDVGSGVKLTKGQAGRFSMLRSNKGWPDLFIAEPNKYHHGLFIELKAEGNSPFLKSGSIKSDEHVRNQAAVIDELVERGYAARFCVGFDETAEVIKNYMGARGDFVGL